MELRGVRGEWGITGVETSIIVIESVVGVSVFGFAVLSAVIIASVVTGRTIFEVLNKTWSVARFNSDVTVFTAPSGPTNADCAPGTIGSHSPAGGTLDAWSSVFAAESGVDPVSVSGNTSAPAFSSANAGWRLPGFPEMNTSTGTQSIGLSRRDRGWVWA